MSEQDGAFRQPDRVDPLAGGELAVLDVDGALANLRGDRSLFEEALTIFLETTPATLRDLEQAVALGQAAAVRLAAHSIKGASSNLGANRVARAAARLEQIAQAGELGGAASLASQLRREFEQVQALRQVPRG
jgi:HPt (histidine-containing phosphotransfer) domain-containing protein